MSLYTTIKPYIEAARMSDLTITEDPKTGAVDLDGITIEVEERPVASIGGERMVPFYLVSYAVPVAQTCDSPPDVDVVEVGAYRHIGEAVRAALGAVLDHRVGRYENQLADAEAAEAFLAEDLDLGSIRTDREGGYDPLDGI